MILPLIYSSTLFVVISLLYRCSFSWNKQAQDTNTVSLKNSWFFSECFFSSGTRRTIVEQENPRANFVAWFVPKKHSEKMVCSEETLRKEPLCCFWKDARWNRNRSSSQAPFLFFERFFLFFQSKKAKKTSWTTPSFGGVFFNKGCRSEPFLSMFQLTTLHWWNQKRLSGLLFLFLNDPFFLNKKNRALLEEKNLYNNGLFVVI